MRTYADGCAAQIGRIRMSRWFDQLLEVCMAIVLVVLVLFVSAATIGIFRAVLSDAPVCMRSHVEYASEFQPVRVCDEWRAGR